MNDDTIRMAREAGCIGPGEGGDPNGLWEPHGHENVTELMFAFAALVRADEREACAKVCDDHATKDGFEGCYANACAESIRARGNT